MMYDTPRTQLTQHHPSPITWQQTPFPHHPHLRPSPHATPHPGIRAKMLRYNVSYPLPFMHPTSHPISAGTKMVPNMKGKWYTQVSTLPAHPANRVPLPRHPGQWAPPRAMNAVKMAWTHHPMPWVPTTCPSTQTRTDAKKPRKPPRTPNRPKLLPGQPLWMWAAHPTLNLAPPLVVVEGCGCAQNVEAGTQDKDDRVIPIVDGHHEQETPQEGWPRCDRART